MNLALMVLAFWSLGRITTKLFKNNQVVKIYYLIAPLCVQFIFYVSWAYGNIPSISLMVFVLYLLMNFFEKNQWRYIVYILPTTFIALAFKLQAQVMIIAIILILLVRLLQAKERRKTIVLAGGLSVVLLFTMPVFRFVANSMQNEYEIGAYVAAANIVQGISAYTEEDQAAYQKLSEDQSLNLTPTQDLIGQWSYIIDNYTATSLQSDEATKQLSIERIRYRLNEFKEDPKMALRFFLRKSLVGWASPDFGALDVWGAAHYYNGKTSDTYKNDPNKPKLFTALQTEHNGRNILLNFADGYETLIYFMSLLGVLLAIKKPRNEKRLLLLIIPLTFMGQFILSLFTESGGRFNFYVFVLLLPFAAAGLFYLSQRIVRMGEQT
jgi:hypothetical protein